MKPLSLEKDAGLVVSLSHVAPLLSARARRRHAAAAGRRLPFDEEFRVAAWRSWRPRRSRTTRRPGTGSRWRVEGDRLRASVDGQQLLDVRDRELAAGHRRPHGEHARAVPGLPRDRHGAPSRGRSASAGRAARARAGRACEPRTRSRSCGRSSTRRASAPAATSASAISTATAALDMLIAQNVPKVRGDAFDHISCLTAVTLDGKVLWQLGRPNPKNGLLTNDTPFQIHDLDGDGRNEVVLVRDFQLQVLDGRTGSFSASAWMPEGRRRSVKDRPYDLNIGDSMLFVDLAVAGRATRNPAQGSLPRILDLRQGPEAALGGQGRPATIRIPIDIDGDGRQEFLIGYSLWDADGKQRWSHDNDAQGSRRRAVDRQLHRPSVGRACARTSAERRRVPRVRGGWHAREAPAARARADAERRQVPPGSCRACRS